MQKTVLWGFFLTALILMGCQTEDIKKEQGDFTVTVTPGDEWFHDFPIFGGITKKNPPTFAVWLTNTEGEFLETLFVSRKMGSSAWVFNQDNRPEALPLWSYMRGKQPTEADPTPDDISGATPREKWERTVTAKTDLTNCMIWLEINHSIDYNSTYAEGIDDTSSPYYSGGKGGSGQPALLYKAAIDLNNPGTNPIELVLTGHSEPGGISDGTIYTDLTGIDSAKKIMSAATVMLERGSK